MQRLMQRAIRKYQRSKKHQHTGILLAYRNVDEFRTSLQCPSLHHHIAGQRCNRRAPSASDNNMVTLEHQHRIRWCDLCRAVHARDTSSAFQIVCADRWQQKTAARPAGLCRA